jgi:hypothetical protein
MWSCHHFTSSSSKNPAASMGAATSTWHFETLVQLALWKVAIFPPDGPRPSA